MGPKHLYADAMTLTASLIWGGAFVAQKAAMEHIGPLEFNGIRFLLGATALLGVEKLALLWERPVLATGNNSRSLKGGILAGLALFGAATLQQVGLLYTTAGKAGLITGLNVVMVPLICLFLGRKPSAGTLLGGLCAALGLLLLSGAEVLEPQGGDLWVLLSAMLWSGHVLLLAHFSPKTDPLALARCQNVVCSALSLAAALCLEDFKSTEFILAWKELFYGGVISVGVAYTLQVAAQRSIHPAHATVLLSMDSLFAVLAGFIFLGEVLGFRELVGGVLMLLGCSWSGFGEVALKQWGQGLRGSKGEVLGMKKQASGHQRRQLYRIVYPLKGRPRIQVGEESFAVVDLCERGIRFLHSEAPGFKIGQNVQAVVHFADGSSLEVQGSVMRVHDKQTVIHLGVPISPAKVLQEQRYLLKYFPGYE